MVGHLYTYLILDVVADRHYANNIMINNLIYINDNSQNYGIR